MWGVVARFVVDFRAVHGAQQTGEIHELAGVNDTEQAVEFQPAGLKGGRAINYPDGRRFYFLLLLGDRESKGWALPFVIRLR